MMRRGVRVIFCAALATCLFASSLGFFACGGASRKTENPTTPQLVFGGTYDNLLPEQRHLYEKWIEEYDEIMGENLDPPEAYPRLPLSTRTTFEAVTHALTRTELTDDSGKSLGKAIELIETVETVLGALPHASGDVQFRIYAYLKPGTVDRLEASREFGRHRDNTHFHLEFPINYRQDGTPSIQFSIAEDEERADIDVDYRSSAFPVLLFNGHLHASNSDVRAGGNYRKHVAKWQGFLDWWRNIFGLPSNRQSAEGSEPPIEEDLLISPVPRVDGKESIAAAVEDFFVAWLVEAKPAIAMSYVEERAYACVLDFEPDSMTTETAPYRLMRDMREASLAVGPVRNLDDAIEAVRPEGLSMESTPNPFEKHFALFRIPAQLINNYQCPHLATTPRPTRAAHGEHYGASMRLKPAHDGEVLEIFQVWTKEAGRWKMVAFHVDPHSDARAAPGVTTMDAAQRQTGSGSVAADPGLVAATDLVLEKWLIDKDYDAAVELFSPRSYDCLNLFHEDSVPVTRVEAPDVLRRRLEAVGDFVGESESPSLESVIQSALPWDPDVRKVSHDRDDAYALLSYTAGHAEQLDCSSRRQGRYRERSGQHGRHFAAAFQLKGAGDHPPVITILWEKEGESWKIIAFDLAIA